MKFSLNDFLKKLFGFSISDPKPTLEVVDNQHVEEVGKCLWIDRTWRTDLKSYIKLGRQLSVTRFGLFVNPSDNNPFKNAGSPQYFKPFVTVEQMIKAIAECEKAGIGVDLTCWIWPHEKYVEQLVDYYLECKKHFPNVRLDLDAEFAWSSRLAGDQMRNKVAKYIYSRVAPGDVSVNDYAGLQPSTELLIVPGVRIRPQAYSVGYVARKGEKVVTDKNSVYWPGRTQKFAMSDRIWGQFDTKVNPLEFGLAAYKPVKGLTIKQQIDMQVEAAMKYKPKELWFWQLNGLSKEYLDAIKDIKC